MFSTYKQDKIRFLQQQKKYLNKDWMHFKDQSCRCWMVKCCVLFIAWMHHGGSNSILHFLTICVYVQFVAWRAEGGSMS